MPALEMLDVNGSTRLWGHLGAGGKDPSFLLVEGGSREELRIDGSETYARLSADGAFVLHVTDADLGHGAAIVDVRNGETWKLPGAEFYASIAWSYGDLALVTVSRDGEDDSLMACDAVTRACNQMPLKDRAVLPTS